MPEFSVGRGTEVPLVRFGEVAAPVAVATIDACPRCGHAMDRHDRIASRYCAATVKGDASRTCICGPDAGPVLS